MSFEPPIGKVIKLNLDPKTTLALLDPEKLIKKATRIQGQISSSMGKPIHKESTIVIEENLILVTKEEVVEKKVPLKATALEV